MASVRELENFIDGNFVKCSHHVDSYNPATGEVFLKVPDSGKEEVELAVKTANTAFKSSVVTSNIIQVALLIIPVCY